MRRSLFLFIFKINRIKNTNIIVHKNKTIRSSIIGPETTILTTKSRIIIYTLKKSRNKQIIAYKTLLNFIVKYFNFFENKLVKIPIKHDIIENIDSNNRKKNPTGSVC